jgi:hypothetical protein
LAILKPSIPYRGVGMRETSDWQALDAMAESLHREVVFRSLGWLAQPDYIAPYPLPSHTCLPSNGTSNASTIMDHSL